MPIELPFPDPAGAPLATDAPDAADPGRAAKTLVVPLVEEQLDVGTRLDEAGAVRVRIEVEEAPERLGVELVAEEYRPWVVAIGAPVADRREPYRDGDELVIPVYEERLVVERRLYLKEEVRLRRVEHVTRRDGEVPLRRERAVVERRQADGSWQPMPVTAGPPVAERTSSAPVDDSTG
jgi:stress response protein YsnF